MSKTIELTNLILISLNLDYEMMRAVASYKMVDSAGHTWLSSVAIFWANLPDPGEDENGTPLPIPDNWFLLPASYFPTLNSLRTDAETALRNRFLV